MFQTGPQNTIFSAQIFHKDGKSFALREHFVQRFLANCTTLVNSIFSNYAFLPPIDSRGALECVSNSSFFNSKYRDFFKKKPWVLTKIFKSVNNNKFVECVKKVNTAKWCIFRRKSGGFFERKSNFSWFQKICAYAVECLFFSLKTQFKQLSRAIK